MTRLTTADRIIRRRMRRAAKDCLIAIHTGHANIGEMELAHFNGYAATLKEHGVPVGTLIEEAHR